MKIFIDKNDNLKSARGGVYALGNFDGVHLGHKEIISKVIDISNSKNIPSGVLIFDPHPRNFFNPKLDDFILSDIKTRSYLLEKTNLDFLGILKFDDFMSNLSPREFVKKIIKNRVGVSHLIVGYNFRFGKNREGDVEILSKICSEFNIDLTIIKQVKNMELIISSSKIREAIEDLDFEKVKRIIGDYWKIVGEVVEGDKRGREIGFPTANITMNNLIKPDFGVYAVRINYNNDTFNGIANFGVRPTFDKTKSLPILEVHLFNFSDNLYGKEIVISFVDFIRKEKKFNGLESLKSQIQLDINIAKDLLGL
jgi:riboflavin kinase/FMN adenylyltransferase